MGHFYPDLASQRASGRIAAENRNILLSDAPPKKGRDKQTGACLRQAGQAQRPTKNCNMSGLSLIHSADVEGGVGHFVCTNSFAFKFV